MSRKRNPKSDPMEHEMELALSPGDFITYDESFSFVEDLEQVAGKIELLVKSDPGRAISLYETFLAACYLKIEEFDDSCGILGQFVDGLYRGWIRARQVGKADPGETAARLLTWMDQDGYGFCHRLECEAVKVFNKKNLTAFTALIRERFYASVQKLGNDNGGQPEHVDYLRRRWGGVLRTLYTAQNDITAYIALAEETSLTTIDCHTIATLLGSKHKLDEALSWVERGFSIDTQKPHESTAVYDLKKLKGDLLVKLGRDEEALAAAWTDYVQYPSIFAYEDLMKYVPKAQRNQWHEKAMEAAMGGDLSTLMDMYFKTKETSRLAELVRQSKDDDLESLSYCFTEPVAKKFEKSHPDLAARLWRAQGLHIVNAKKSKYYDAAIRNLERAKGCFFKAGQEGEWDRTVVQIRADHRRKSGFMPGFERLVEGKGPSNEPSFLSLAKARWKENDGKKS